MGCHVPPAPGPAFPSDHDRSRDELPVAPLRILPAAGSPAPRGQASSTTDSLLAIPPFVWQRDDRLFILGVDPVGWVTAELAFDPRRLTYVEVHRAIYHWPREAVGAFLARAGGHSLLTMHTLANELGRWSATRDSHAGPPVA